MLKWYLEPWKKYAQFGGRSRRREIWWWQLGNTLIVVGIYALSIMSGAVDPETLDVGPGFWVFYSAILLLLLVGILPGVALMVRRLHDTGTSGWWVLVIAVPVANLFVFLHMLFSGSDEGPNKFGPDPKAEERG